MKQFDALPPEPQPDFYAPDDRESKAVINFMETCSIITDDDRKSLLDDKRKTGDSYLSSFI